MKETIVKFLNERFKDDADLQGSKTDCEEGEMPLFDFLVMEVERFYNEFSINTPIETWLDKTYKKNIPFFDTHEKLADQYYL